MFSPYAIDAFHFIITLRFDIFFRHFRHFAAFDTPTLLLPLLSLFTLRFRC